MSLKEEILELLEKDREFRYAVAGLIGLKEILTRLDRHEEELVKLREDMNKLREDMNRLREDMNRGFERHDKMFEKHWTEIQKLREDMNKGFERHDKMFERHWNEIQKLREDMNAGFKRHDELFEKHWREIQRLREDMNKGFDLLKRHIDALGARWGIMSEEAFREGLKSLIEEEFGYRVERWTGYDEEGYVYGYPSQVEVDVAIHDDKTILIEIKSYVRASDVYIFKRKSELYEKIKGKKPDKLVIVTPYIENKALEAAEKFGIEVYTKV